MLQGTDGLGGACWHDYPRSLGIRSVIQGALEDARICNRNVSLRAENSATARHFGASRSFPRVALHPWSISPWRNRGWRGCDEAWRLQAALDAVNGTPQVAEVSECKNDRSARLRFFSPLPRWAKRQLDVVATARLTCAARCFSYLIPPSDLGFVRQFLVQSLWMSVVAVEEHGRGMSMAVSIGETIAELHRSLRDYIEATYHVSHPVLVKLRRDLLDQPGVISQRPYLETTPRYREGANFANIKGLDSGCDRDISQRLPAPPRLIYDSAVRSPKHKPFRLFLLTGEVQW